MRLKVEVRGDVARATSEDGRTDMTIPASLVRRRFPPGSPALVTSYFEARIDANGILEIGDRIA